MIPTRSGKRVQLELIVLCVYMFTMRVAGPTVRVDTTLVGFEHLSWQRGRQTLIFQATGTEREGGEGGGER